MSQSTARKSRRATSNGNGSAIEKLPDLEDFLGLDDKAAIDADKILGMARSMRNLDRTQIAEDLKGSDVIPGINPEQRTFDQQRKLIRKAYGLLVEQVKADGYWALVEAKLNQAKQG
jgi:hypothetical protein